jgi:2-polyprenyl-3-methyl-5-hydroxy-6-metoxy-1,4-benzoquinol methylase
MHTYSNCPICDSLTLNSFLKINDLSVSKEEFELLKCDDCRFVLTQNIPTQENIGKYYQFDAYISHTDTKKSWMDKLYHFVRSITLFQKLYWVKSFTKKAKGTILDIGSGTGAFLNYAKNKNWVITGIEADKSARAKGLELHNIETSDTNTLFSLKQNSYDAITMWHVLEHVHQLNDYMYQIKKLLNGAGKLFIAVPNYTSYDAKFYKKYWAAYDVPRHLYHFSPQAMQRLAQKYNFKIVSYKAMWFDSFYVSFLSEKYKNGNVIRAAFIAFWSNFLAIFNSKKCSSITYVMETNTTIG